MKIYEGEEGIFKDVQDAISYMKDTNFNREVSVYDINEDAAFKKARKIYAYIKGYNKGKPLNEQILPQNIYAYRGILGCLGVQVCAIGLGTYEKNKNLLALFTGFNDSVLDQSKETAEICPSEKAMTSLMLLGQMW